MNGNRLLNTMNTIVDYILLNLLWVIVSIPLFTFFPATAAMFGVVRKRQLQKDSEGIFKDFFTLFKENFKQSFVLSIIWSLLAIFLYFDYLFINPENSIVHLILYIVLMIGLVLFSVITIHLFPIMVHFDLSWKLVIRNAFFFSLMNPILTVFLLVIVAIGVIIIYTFPAAIFIVGSPLAYIIYYLSQIFFNQVMTKKEMN
ncbi:MAG: YesL family protein [Bacillota bacterium]